MEKNDIIRWITIGSFVIIFFFLIGMILKSYLAKIYKNFEITVLLPFTKTKQMQVSDSVVYNLFGNHLVPYQ